MSDWYDAARAFIKTKVTTSDNSFGGLMSAWFKAGAPATASVPNATTTTAGVVKQSAAQADLVAAPTQADFNGLLAKLRTAGILAP